MVSMRLNTRYSYLGFFVVFLLGITYAGILDLRTLPEKFQKYFLHSCSGDQCSDDKRGVITDEVFHLSVVACGHRFEEALVNIKSSLLFSSSKIFYHIFAEKELHPRFEERIQSWPLWHRRYLSYKLYPVTYPDDGYQKNWKALFKPCASLRIFLPAMLPETVDSVIYVDADTLFLADVKDLWSYFNEFNATQLCSFAMEYINLDIGWYNRFALHPYYGSTGINAGVALMNLTRMRKAMFKNDVLPNRTKWISLLLPLYKKYRYDLSWGEQDLLNIVFHYNPEMLHILPCRWNFRTNHCTYGLTCTETLEKGVKVLHGKTESFLNEKEPAFKAVYETIRDYKFHRNYSKYIVKPLEKALLRTANTNCGKEREVILKAIRDIAGITS